MPKRYIRFNLKKEQPCVDLFLRDPKADFIVILQKKIFPLHKQLLQKSDYFNELIAANKKSVAIHEHFNPDFFQKILGTFYGIQAAFERHYLIDHILRILSLLRVNELDQQLKNDMRVNFDEYGLFNLFYLSEKFDLKDIEDKCLKQLVDQQFQQINYNKYDLFQLSPDLFIYILKQHEKMKARRFISGLQPSQIRSVCQQYCKTNSVQINIDDIFRYGRECLKQSVSDNQQKQSPKPRKRNATWNNPKARKQSFQQKKSSQTIDLNFKLKKDSFSQKQSEVMKIKQINSNMQQNNNRLAEQLKTVKNSIGEANQQTGYGIDDLDKKLKEFQEKSNIAHKKLQELKNKMLKMNFDQQINGNEEHINQTRSFSHLNNNIQRQSKLLQSMGVLDKEGNIDSESSDI